jgi:hypothetical protein
MASRPASRVRCPCCKGEKYVLVFEEIKIPGIEMPSYCVDNKPCGHCEGTGKVDAEVEEC